MDNALTNFLSAQTVIFAIVVWFITVGFRFVIESISIRIAYIFPDKYESYWVDLWKEWILPVLPIFIGGLLAYFISGYPYPSVFAKTITARVFFGLVAGGAAGYAYRFFKYKLDQLLPKRIKEIQDNFSDPTQQSEIPPMPTTAEVNAIKEAEKAE
jgi:hypothetical protein